MKRNQKVRLQKALEPYDNELKGKILDALWMDKEPNYLLELDQAACKLIHHLISQILYEETQNEKNT